MPYKILNGTDVMHFKNGKWTLKQRAKNSQNAHKILGLLNGIEAGTIDSSSEGVAKYKRRKKIIDKHLNK